ncbi:hypothetical protein [Helicobacter pylori]|uniref:hypothetical protein n=1 Tax=Helicobacter pylori TaxID=210 RepID=UPI0034658163
MQNHFLVFLVSEKLDTKLSDNLLKSAFFIGGLSGVKKGRMISKYFLYSQENKMLRK